MKILQTLNRMRKFNIFLIYCILFPLGNSAKALENIRVRAVDSLTAVISKENDFRKSIDLQNLMVWELSYYNLDSAETIVNNIIKATKYKGYKKGEIKASSIKGNILMDRGNFDEALGIFKGCYKAAVINNEQEIEVSVIKYISNVFYYLGKTDSAIFYCEKIIQILDQNKSDSSEYITPFTNLAAFYMDNGNYKKSRSMFERIINLQIRYKQEAKLGVLFGNFGLLYQKMGNYEKALECFFKSQKQYEKNGDMLGQVTSLNNIGLVKHNQEDISQAEKYYQSALKIALTLNAPSDLASCYYHLGNLNNHIGSYKAAIPFLEKALKIARENNSERYISKYAIELSWSLAEVQRFPQAIELGLLSLEIRKNSGDLDGLVEAYEYLSHIFKLKKDYNKAAQYLNKAVPIARELNSFTVYSNIYKALSDLFIESGRFDSAYFAIKKSHAYHDSVINEEKVKVSGELEAIYENEKKQLTIENMNQKEIAQNAIIKKQNIQRIAFFSGFILMLLLAVIIFRGYKEKKKHHEIVMSQKKEVELQKEKVETIHQEITDSITYARRIQMAILPPDKLFKTYLKNSFVLYRPKDIVAGDFYWLETKGDKVYFAVADCTGHGVPGAMMSVICSNALTRALKESDFNEPGKILDKTVLLLSDWFAKSEVEMNDGMDLAMCCLDLQNKKLEYAGANNSLYYIRDGILNEIKANKQPVGKYVEIKPFTNHIIDLLNGDSVFIFSDGFPDQFGGPLGKKFKYSKFKELLTDIASHSPESQMNVLNLGFDDWRGSHEQIDDVCILGLKFLA